MTLPTTNRVRIVGGSCRGRIVRFPPAPGLRPTSDRVRETLFNWLGQDLTGRTTLDLFAGSGALSLESLSRGAARAVAVERNPKLVDALRENGRQLGLAGLEVHRGNGTTWLARDERRYDVVYLDPPFADDPWSALLPACAAHLAPGGFIYAEAGRRLAPPPGLSTHREDRAGQVYYHLFALADDRAADANRPS